MKGLSQKRSFLIGPAGCTASTWQDALPSWTLKGPGIVSALRGLVIPNGSLRAPTSSPEGHGPAVRTAPIITVPRRLPHFGLLPRLLAPCSFEATLLTAPAVSVPPCGVAAVGACGPRRKRACRRRSGHQYRLPRNPCELEDASKEAEKHIDERMLAEGSSSVL